MFEPHAWPSSPREHIKAPDVYHQCNQLLTGHPKGTAVAIFANAG
jgi:hypothetical protein